MDDITGNFMTECLIKVQTFFESMCGKKSAGWMDTILKKNLELSVSTQVKKTRVRYHHAADVRYHLDCWLVQACLPGAIVTTITTFLICCKCNRQYR